MGATWTQIGDAPRSVRSLQATTEAVPTLVTDGFSVDEVAGITVHVMAGAGETINAAGGIITGYRWDEVALVWNLASELDYLITAADVGARGFSYPIQILVPRSRIALIATGVGVSAGTLTLDFLMVYLSGKVG